MEIVYVIEDFSMKGGAERIIAEKANYLAVLYVKKLSPLGWLN